MGTRIEGLLDTRLDAITDDAIGKFFDPEFLNRIDEVTVFDELTDDTAVQIIYHELELFTARSAKRGVDLTVDASAAKYLVRHGFDPAFGARSVRRSIRFGCLKGRRGADGRRIAERPHIARCRAMPRG